MCVYEEKESGEESGKGDCRCIWNWMCLEYYKEMRRRFLYVCQ